MSNEPDAFMDGLDEVSKNAGHGETDWVEADLLDAQGRVICRGRFSLVKGNARSMFCSYPEQSSESGGDAVTLRITVNQKEIPIPPPFASSNGNYHFDLDNDAVLNS